MYLKKKQVISLTLSSVLCLSGCGKLDMDAEELDTFIDGLVNSAVEFFVTSDDSTTMGDMAPPRGTATESQTISNQAETVYYNQAVWEGSIHVEVVGNGSNFTGGWEVEGILLENLVMDEASMTALRQVSVGEEFAWSYKKFHDSKVFSIIPVTCTKLDENQGIETLSFQFINQEGIEILYVVDPDGRVCYPQGGYVRGEVDFVRLFIPNTARLLDSIQTDEFRSYESFQGYYDYRLENNAFYNGEARYWMDFNISSGMITDVHATDKG